MTGVLGVSERIDRRILGALRFLDATIGLPIREPLVISAPGIRLVKNTSGDTVLFDAPGRVDLQAYTSTFSQPPASGNVSLAVQVTDPSGQYLPRQVVLSLPRDPDPAHAAAADSLFQPIKVNLFRAPAAPVSPAWAVIRATVTDSADRRLPWALVRVVQTSPARVTLSQADWRGEALIAVPGIPITLSGTDGGAVIASEVDVSLEVVFDSTLQTIPAASDFSTLTDPNFGYFPNPDALSLGTGTLLRGSLSDKLASGRGRSRTLAVTLV